MEKPIRVLTQDEQKVIDLNAKLFSAVEALKECAEAHKESIKDMSQTVLTLAEILYNRAIKSM